MEQETAHLQTISCSVRLGCQQQVFYSAVAVTVPNQSPRKLFLETDSQGSAHCTQGVASSTTRTHHPQQLSSLQFFVVSSRSSPLLILPRSAKFHQKETRYLDCEAVQSFLIEHVPNCDFRIVHVVLLSLPDLPE